jgi:ABC-type Fe3+ transport system substrate-binding protein
MNRLGFILVLLLTLIARQLAIAAENHTSNLIEGAKKEGKLVVYTSMNQRDMTLLVQEFTKRYPFIDAQIFRANSQKLLPRIETEARAKKHQADVFTASFPIWPELMRQKLVTPYQSPEGQRYPKELKDPNGYWTILYLQIMGMAYNTRLVPAGRAPKRYEDLLNPQWKSQEIGMDYRDNTWFAVMMEIMGEREGLSFMKRLAAKDLYMRENKSLLTQLMAAGEFLVLANTYVDTAVEYVKAGAPIEWVPGRDPVPASTHLLGIYSFASHLNASKLFVDFLLSKEGQKAMSGGAVAKFPANPEVESELRAKIKGHKLHPIDPTMASKFDRLTKNFEEIFWKK